MREPSLGWGKPALEKPKPQARARNDEPKTYNFSADADKPAGVSTGVSQR